MFIIYYLFGPLLLALAELIAQRGLSFKFLGKLKFWLLSLAAALFCYAAITIALMSFTAAFNFTPYTLGIAIIASVFFAGIRLAWPWLKSKQSFISLLTVALCTAFFLECVVFNMRAHQTYYYEPINLTESFEVPDELVPVKNETNKYTVAKSGTTITIEFNDINTKIHNIYFDIDAFDKTENPMTITVKPSFTDESNKNYSSTPSQAITSDTSSTKYLYFVTNGVSEKLKFSFSSDGTNYTINSIVANARRDFSFNILRFLLVAIIAFVALLLRPKSKIYDVKMSFSSRQRNITVFVIFIEIALLCIISFFNPAFEKYPSSHHAQYNQLAESFLEGRLYLEKEPPEFLAEMENPYDYNARTQAAADAKATYYWDASYFDGHYYVYFGVLPVLLFYLPFRAITQLELPNRVVIQMCLALFVIGAFLLIAKMIKKYFKPSKIPFVSYIALSLIFVNASGAVFIAKRPDFYSIPIILSLALVMFGLYFWLKSTDDPLKVNALYAFLGSLFMALVAAARPQFLFVSVLAIVLFWSSVFTDRTLFSKKSIKSTIAICLPYLLVAAGVMWYNYARFGSPFDFGQNYNLTTNDMTGRGFRFERVGLSIFTYFFQTPNINAAFPFVDRVEINTSYLGTTITEPMFGGIFATIPLLWILLLVPSISEKLKKNNLFYLVLMLPIISLATGIFDAQGAGLLQRYVADFAYLAILAAIIVVFFFYENAKEESMIQLNTFTSFSLYASGFYCFFMIFAVYGTEIYYKNYSLFANAAQLIQFWK